MDRFWFPRSLKSRLLVASFVLLPVVIVVAGFALQNSFAYSLQSALEKRLRLQAFMMIGAAEMEGGRLVISSTKQRFQLGRDITGFIHSRDNELNWASDPISAQANAVQQALQNSSLKAGLTRFTHFSEIDKYLYQYPVVWEGTKQSRFFTFSVIESGEELTAELNSYASKLWGWLLAATVFVLLVQTIITRWGLSPLSHLVRDLRSIEKGESHRLDGLYPREVQGVTDSLNHLLHSERNQRERYRNTLGDLAHSLKTPLAVIRGAGDEHLPYDGYRTVVDDQVRRMDQIVQYQLARAVRSQSNTIAHTTPLSPLITRITSALEKVYREKCVDIDLDLDETALFGADDRDMMELLGNLLENAFKYCHSAVKVTLSRDSGYVRLCIEDDGPGVSPGMRHVILQRGARVDTSAAPGQGIGLTVAVDILSSYDGQLEVGESDLGGARFSIGLPVG